MKYAITHRTRYGYDAPVTSSFAQVHQLPGSVDGQVCEQRSITADPPPEHIRERIDYFDNLTAFLSIDEEHSELTVTASSVVDTTARAISFPKAAGQPWERFTASLHGLDLTAVEFVLDSPLVVRSSRLHDYARPSFPDGRSLSEAVADLCMRIHSDFEFKPGSTDVSTTIDEVFDLRSGVCQDFSHVMIGSLRSIGIPAGYVSGYLETDPPPGEERLTGVDRTHAWVGVYIGEAGWVGIDPTNNQLAGPRYITTARGRDYSDVPPLKGVIYTDAEESKLEVEVDVVPA
jgi:transglutaminase-like putative cysteine protease